MSKKRPSHLIFKITSVNAAIGQTQQHNILKAQSLSFSGEILVHQTMTESLGSEMF